MRNLNMYGVLFFVVFFANSCTAATEKNDVMRAALNGYCKNKSQNVLQNTSISLGGSDDSSFSNLHGINSEALADAFVKNKTPSVIMPVCDQLVLLSEEEIRLAFKNKPNKPREKNDFFLDDEWASFYEKYPGVKGIVKVSQPGYSKDGLYAVIYTTSICAPLCGYAFLTQYKNVDGKWVFDRRELIAQS
ncbi:MAG: hypothetical protein V4660_16975 [Pseudomonadota bacterium]